MMACGEPRGDQIAQTRCHAIMGFHQNIGLQQAGRFGGVQQVNLAPFNIANHNGFARLTGRKIIKRHLAGTGDTIRHAIISGKARAQRQGGGIGITRDDLGMGHQARKTDRIIAFSATNIDDLAILPRDNFGNNWG